MRSATPISLERARELVLAACSPLPSEQVPLAQAHGRVLAQNLRAATDLPRFANSSMDGYAVQSGGASRVLQIVGESRAGTPWSGTLAAGQAIRISTGAPLPNGADGVLPLENGAEDHELLTAHAATHSDDFVRHAGEDMRRGEIALDRGTMLGPFELAVAVGAGASSLMCAQRPRVAVLTTGSELREPGATLGPGEVHDSNLLALSALTRAANGEVISAERVGDDPQATRTVLARTFDGADVVTIAGGVSVGRHDHVKDALAELGVQEHFWGVQIRPGRPTWFGVAGSGSTSTLVFGLPGNPVSATVIHVLLVRGALRKLQGGDPTAGRIQATLGATVRRNANRAEAVRVALHAHSGATLVATPTGPQESHVSTSLIGAQGLAFIEAGEQPLEAGASVEVELLL